MYVVNSCLLKVTEIEEYEGSHFKSSSLDVVRLHGRAELGQSSLVELELLGLLFEHVGKVEADTDKVTLSGIVALIIIVVDDHIVAIVLSRSHVLEVIQVEWVGEDIVRVSALEGLALCLGSRVEGFVLVLSEESSAEVLADVFFFLLGPLAVLLIEALPVVIDGLINFDIADLKTRHALVQALGDQLTEVPDEVKDDECSEKRPFDAFPSFAGENFAKRVVSNVDVVGHDFFGKVVVFKKLLVGGHPVAKADVQKRGELKLVEHIVGQALVVHGRHDIAVEEVELFDDVQDQE